MVYGSIMTQFHECNTRIMHFSNIFCHKLFQHMYYKVKHHDAGFVFKTYLDKDAIAITGLCYIYKTNELVLLSDTIRLFPYFHNPKFILCRL